MRSIVHGLAVVLVGATVGVGAQTKGGGGAAAAGDPAAGAKVYEAQKCAMCHSVAGKGNQKGALDDVGSRLGEEEIRQWMLNPRVMTEKTKATRKPLMPAYTKLSEKELHDVIAYMQSLKK